MHRRAAKLRTRLERRSRPLGESRALFPWALGIVLSLAALPALARAERAPFEPRFPVAVASPGAPSTSDLPPPYQPPGMNCWDFWHVLVNGTYYTYYLQSPISDHFEAPTIGLATSTDLVHMTEFGEVMRANPPGQWNDAWVATGSVWWNVNEWRMVFAGPTHTGSDGMGLARSDDLFHWTRIGTGPIHFITHPFVVPTSAYWQAKGFAPGRSLAYIVLTDCYVLPEPIDGLYYMVANCLLADESISNRGVVGLMHSSDGLVWEQGPIIAAPRLYEQMEAPQLWKHGDRWYLNFGAARSNPLYRATMVYTAPSMEGPFEPGPRPELHLPDYTGWFYVGKFVPGPNGSDLFVGGIGGRMSRPYPVSYDPDGSISLAPFDATPSPWRPEGLTGLTGEIVPDLAGGVISDGRVRVNAAGNRVWGAPGAPSGMAWASDGHGGTVGVLESSGDIVSGRTGIDGTTPWGPSVEVCDAPAWQGLPAVAPDGAGGSLYAWMDHRGSSHDIYVQRFDALGNPMWTANGVAVCTADGTQAAPALVADGTGGAIVAWYDDRPTANGGADVYAQRISASGTPMWATNGVAIGAATGVQQAPVIATDGSGGAFIAWWDDRGGDRDVYLQRVGPDGVSAWRANGWVVAPGANDQLLPALAADGEHGVFVAWEDHRITGDEGLDIYAQHVSPRGALLWPVQGVPVCREPHRQIRPSVAADGAGGMYVAWMDARDGADVSPARYTPYVQRFDHGGVRQWKNDGVRVQIDPGTASQDRAPSIVAGDAGLFVSGTSALHRVLADGRLAWMPAYSPTIESIADVPGDEGGFVTLRFGEPASRTAGLTPDVLGYRVWRRVSGAEPPPAGWEVVVDAIPVGAPSITMTVPTHADAVPGTPAVETFCVEAITSIPGAVLASPPVTAQSTDDRAPQAPVGLSGNRQGTSLVLRWSPGAEPDLTGYRVYKGTSPTFALSAANLVASPSAPQWIDPSFDPATSHYKVTAVDRHTNESTPTAIGPGQISDAPGPVVPGVSFLARFAPNPMRGSIAIQYGLARAGAVSMRIYDPSGRQVRTLVEGFVDAGVHAVRWEARDASDRPVPPGLYLVRLIGPGIAASRKLVVAE